MPPFILTFELVKKESAPIYRPLFRDRLRRGAHKYQLSCWLINLATRLPKFTITIGGSFKRTTG